MRPVNESVQSVISEMGYGGQERPQQAAKPATGGTITYTENPTQEQLERAAEIIDGGGQLGISMSPGRLKGRGVNYLVCALNEEDECVGVATVKGSDGNSAEMGYLAVDPEYRRKGIAQTLSKMRLKHAKSMGLGYLKASIRESNNASRKNTERSGFVPAGTRMGIVEPLVYYVLPMNMSEDEAIEDVIHEEGLEGID